ncbi:hypothetical protein Smic_63200 [Streptomyces microflavus]|nr:hypothetical protein Smic_63200 [Streptomyces microflavus]
MYAVEQPARPVDSWVEHGAIVDAVARGDAERARALTAQHAERAAGAHRLRRPDRTGRRAAPLPRVSSSQHGVNIAGVRH